MPKNSAEDKTVDTRMPISVDANGDASFGKVVTPADVDWLDHYGATLIHGHRFTPGDVAEFEYRHDRTPIGSLRMQAKERIARILTIELATRIDLWDRARHARQREREAQRLAQHDAARSCDTARPVDEETGRMSAL